VDRRIEKPQVNVKIIVQEHSARCGRGAHSVAPARRRVTPRRAAARGCCHAAAQGCACRLEAQRAAQLHLSGRARRTHAPRHRTAALQWHTLLHRSLASRGDANFEKSTRDFITRQRGCAGRVRPRRAEHKTSLQWLHMDSEVERVRPRREE
jgi:hypothetical protein